MQYILLLRSVNLGKLRKVSMPELKKWLAALGYENVTSYINSGNLLFVSSRDKTTVAQEITELLAEHYDFEIPFSLLTADEYRKDAHNLPEWWNEDMPRLDAMFLTVDADRHAISSELEALQVPDEVLHLGACAVYFGNYTTPDYRKAQYGKFLSKKSVANQLTLRNAATFTKILELLD
ncbi:DUF1697 domain-containing protein [Rothia dentocariosa]|uniref:DUF1697 domain-containing protein n=1 Tax=Rothia dentocariosa TaxID=2047 RepID=UPI0028E22C77|nr:DUF1697 domain-containing protein [Rothia dentocariosa]